MEAAIIGKFFFIFWITTIVWLDRAARDDGLEPERAASYALWRNILGFSFLGLIGLIILIGVLG